MMPGVKTLVARGVSYFAVAQFLMLFLTLLMAAVLTRILTPEDFGIASVAIIFMALFSVIQEFGIAAAVIQRDSRVDEAISTGLALRWMIGAVLFATMLLASPLIAAFYGNPAIALVLVVISVNLFIQPFGFAAFVTLSRQLRFQSISIANMMQSVIYTLSSILLALAGFSYWSIVYGSLIGSFSFVIVLNCWGRVSHWPRIEPSIARELMGFGAHLLVISLMTYVIFSIDQLLIGKALGMSALGTYFIAVRFSRAIAEQVSIPVCRVLFPVMARMKNSYGQMRSAYLQSLRMTMIVLSPLAFGIAALAPIFVSVVLGQEFGDASVLISILAFQGLAFALALLVRNVMVAMGRPKHLTIQSSVQAILVALLVYPVATTYGLNGVCYLVTGLSLCALTYLLVSLSRMLKVGVEETLRLVAPPIIGGIATFFSVFASVSLLPQTPVSLVVACLAGMCSYVVVLYASSAGRDVRDMVNLFLELF